MGLIEIEGMEFYAYHGHFAEEQMVGNHFLVDVAMHADCDVASKSDDLKDVLDYQHVYRIVKEEMAIPSKLLERIAKRIIDRFYHSFDKVEKTTVKIRKMNPPMGGKMASVSVTLSK